MENEKTPEISSGLMESAVCGRQLYDMVLSAYNGEKEAFAIAVKSRLVDSTGEYFPISADTVVNTLKTTVLPFWLDRLAAEGNQDQGSKQPGDLDNDPVVKSLVESAVVSKQLFMMAHNAFAGQEASSAEGKKAQFEIIVRAATDDAQGKLLAYSPKDTVDVLQKVVLPFWQAKLAMHAKNFCEGLFAVLESAGNFLKQQAKEKQDAVDPLLDAPSDLTELPAGLYLKDVTDRPAYQVVAGMARYGKKIEKQDLTLEQLIALNSEKTNRLCKAQGIPELSAAEMETTARHTMEVFTSLYRTFVKMKADRVQMISYITTVNHLVREGHDDLQSIVSMVILQYGAQSDHALARKHLAKIPIVDEKLEARSDLDLKPNFSLDVDFPKLADSIIQRIKSELRIFKKLPERFYFLTANGRVLTKLAPKKIDRDQMVVWLKYFIREHQLVGIIHVMEAWTVTADGEVGFMVKDKEFPPYKDKKVIGETLTILAQANNGFFKVWLVEIKRLAKGKPFPIAAKEAPVPHGRFAGLFDSPINGLE